MSKKAPRQHTGKRAFYRLTGALFAFVVCVFPIAMAVLAASAVLTWSQAVAYSIAAWALSAVAWLVMVAYALAVLLPRQRERQHRLAAWCHERGLTPQGARLYRPSGLRSPDMLALQQMPQSALPRPLRTAAQEWETVLPPDVPLYPFTLPGFHVARLHVGGTSGAVTMNVADTQVRPTVSEQAAGAAGQAVQVVAATGLGEVPLMWIEPRGTSDDWPLPWVGSDVTVESAEFMGAWRVRAGDARAAHGVLTPTVIVRLLESDARGHVYGFAPGVVSVAMSHDLTSLDQLSRAFDVVRDVAGSLPSYLRRA